MRHRTNLAVRVILGVLMTSALACGSDTEESSVPDEPDMASVPDEGSDVVRDMVAKDMNVEDVLMPPALIELTEDDARGAWKNIFLAEIVDGRLLLTTASPVSALVEVSLDEEPSLLGHVSMQQPPFDSDFTERPSILGFGINETAAFIKTGQVGQSSDGSWLWTIDHSSHSVEGALWLEDCLSIASNYPMPVVESTFFVTCSGKAFENGRVIAIDVSDLERPRISKSWEQSRARSLHLAKVQEGTHSFVANQLQSVEYVSIDPFDAVTTSKFEFSDETGSGHRNNYASMERDDELWIVSGTRKKQDRFQEIPGSHPTGLLRGLRVVGGELEVIEEYVFDEAVEDLDGAFFETMWFDGDRTLVLGMSTVTSPGEPVEVELHAIDVKAEPPSIARSVDIGGAPDSDYKNVVQILEHEDDLLIVRYSNNSRLPPFQRIPKSELTID